MDLTNNNELCDLVPFLIFVSKNLSYETYGVSYVIYNTGYYGDYNVFVWK